MKAVSSSRSPIVLCESDSGLIIFLGLFLTILQQSVAYFRLRDFQLEKLMISTFRWKISLKKRQKKKSAPHSPQKKRRPKRENGIDVFEIRRRRKEREKKGETICGARSQRGRLKTSENFFLRLHQRFFLLLPEKKMLRFFFFVPLYFTFLSFQLDADDLSICV